MDSVCAAYSYAVLKNRIDSSNEYIPVMLGTANGNTKNAFAKMGIELPRFLRDVRTRVGEVQRKPVDTVSSSDPLYLLMDIFQRKRPSVVPVMDDGVYKGLLSADDINGFFLRENSGAIRQKYLLSEENIERVIEGEFLKRGNATKVRAPYMVGAMEYQVYRDRLERLVDKVDIQISLECFLGIVVEFSFGQFIAIKFFHFRFICRSTGAIVIV